MRLVANVLKPDTFLTVIKTDSVEYETHLNFYTYKIRSKVRLDSFKRFIEF
jgi:hypothetical protein